MTVSTTQLSPSAAPLGVGVWLLPAVCFAALSLYTFSSLWGTVWEQEAHSHGPLVAAIAAWLFWRQPRPAAAAPGAPELLAGWGLLAFGLLAHVAGRVVGIPFVEVLGLAPTAAALALIAAGRAGLRAYWFPLLFLVFLVPLPDFMLEALTGSLKNKVSWATENLLHTFGYPIARDGVTLTIGQYQLLVADACSGLNSIVALAAMGVLYTYLMGHRNVWRNGLLLLAVVPIALGVNLIRVLFLVLLTYHAGDEAGQGFLHGAAGLTLFVAGLALLFLLDALLGRVPALRDGGARA
jgi:exosortase B